MREAAINPIRILIVDDHTLVREGLKMLIENESDMLIVGEAGNSADALAISVREQPDVIVLDLDLGGEDAIDFLPALMAGSEGSRVLILTGVKDLEKHRRAVHLGAVGVLLKDQAGQTLIKAIRKVYAGEVWLDRAIIAKILSDSARTDEQRRRDPKAAKLETLTKREREVIALVATGLTTKRIAERLFISEKTVSNHLTAIYNKLNLANRLELALYASRHRLAK
jgi:two-component system, NarL family, nitrate/nitrite response regulator NarL